MSYTIDHVMHWLSGGEVASLEDAAAWLARAEELLDMLGTCVDLGVPVPTMLLLDLSALVGALGAFVRDRQPRAWESEAGESLNLTACAEFAFEMARAGVEQGSEAIATFDAIPRALRAALRDLGPALRLSLCEPASQPGGTPS